ncbi:pseudaminic acid cytidylyltransferase [Pontibacter sp. BAB1700]|uniref:pseudaminic acid cytidylyltransferase n=1 Tax=Pontibacter sp. BAB1700 TaxID=1144253 RepID=UPI00026BC9C0|nr:pseudaminic acid cytidylyltransferase [Pontibacter sp. BAB1700]EJF09715.1 pseudaminic acid CMP-transferase [Pontibacter sp. BAB1700]
MSNVAIIPARGGSKRIPRKNIRDFLGKPIIAYSIETALASGLFDKVMVSTDDEEIAAVAVKYGAEVPFFRSSDNSNDYAPLKDVLLEVLDRYKEQGMDFKSFACILPTAPLIQSKHLIDSFQIIQDGFKSVISIVEYEFPIQRSLHLEEEKLFKSYPELYSKRSQDLSSYYHDAGQFYWADIKHYLKHKSFFSESIKGYILNRKYFQDIDTIEDWEIAEVKFKYVHEQNKTDLHR